MCCSCLLVCVPLLYSSIVWKMGPASHSTADWLGPDKIIPTAFLSRSSFHLLSPPQRVPLTCSSHSVDYTTLSLLSILLCVLYSRPSVWCGGREFLIHTLLYSILITFVELFRAYRPWLIRTVVGSIFFFWWRIKKLFFGWNDSLYFHLFFFKIPFSLLNIPAWHSESNDEASTDSQVGQVDL